MLKKNTKVHEDGIKFPLRPKREDLFPNGMVTTKSANHKKCKDDHSKKHGRDDYDREEPTFAGFVDKCNIGVCRFIYYTYFFTDTIRRRVRGVVAFKGIGLAIYFKFNNRGVNTTT